MAKKQQPRPAKPRADDTSLDEELRAGREFMKRYERTFKALAKS